MGFNNPSEIAWFEAKKLWNNDIKCMLSLGTGDVKHQGKASNPVAMASQLLDLVTSSHQVHLRIKQFVTNYNPDVKYFRLNPPELGRFDLAESSASVLELIQKETLAYLEKEEEHFKQLCNVLSNRIDYEIK